MAKILFVTVGGSPQPILTAIQSLKPDRLIFVCSEGSLSQVTGEGKPCELRQGAEIVERLPNIPTQLNLGDRFQADRDVVLVNADQLSEVYQAIVKKIREIQAADPEAELLADYTGGTKTMSVGLAIAALDYQLRIFLTSGNRTDLIKVNRGESVKIAQTSGLTVHRALEQELPKFLKQFNYSAAIAELEILLQTIEYGEAQQAIARQLNLCRGLDLWDQFNHVEAWYYLEAEMKTEKLRPLILFLKRVMGSREAIAEAMDTTFQAPDRIHGHGYEVIEDLLLNADRRASMGRYDDAVGRLYRATELLAQIRLWRDYGIKTGDVDLTQLPEDIRPQYEALGSPEGKIQIGLKNSYQLLSQFEGDAVGKVYLKHEQRLFDQLKVRNYSILAHGLQSITAEDYQKHFRAVVVPFLETALKAAIAGKKSFESVQFPTIF